MYKYITLNCPFMNIKTKKVFRTISKLILLIVGLGFVGYIGYLGYLSYTAKPYKVSITNLTDSSFTVSWVTDSPAKGFVHYKETNSFLPGILAPIMSNRAYDDRDWEYNQNVCVTEFNEGVEVDDNFTVSAENFNCDDIDVKYNGYYYTHHVTLRDLDPEKEYFFRIGDGFWSWKADEVSAETFSTLQSVQSPKPVFGKVVFDDEFSSYDSIIYGQFVNLREGKESVLYSSVTNEDGGWYLDASSVRTEEGEVFEMEDGNDFLYVTGQILNLYLTDVHEWLYGSFDGAYPDISWYTEEEELESMGINTMDDVLSYVNTKDIDNGDVLGRFVGEVEAKSNPPSRLSNFKTTITKRFSRKSSPPSEPTNEKNPLSRARSAESARLQGQADAYMERLRAVESARLQGQVEAQEFALEKAAEAIGRDNSRTVSSASPLPTSDEYAEATATTNPSPSANSCGPCAYGCYDQCTADQLRDNATNWGHTNCINALARNENNGVVNKDILDVFGLANNPVQVAATLSLLGDGGVKTEALPGGPTASNQGSDWEDFCFERGRGVSKCGGSQPPSSLPSESTIVIRNDDSGSSNNLLNFLGDQGLLDDYNFARDSVVCISSNNTSDITPDCDYSISVNQIPLDTIAELTFRPGNIDQQEVLRRFLQQNVDRSDIQQGTTVALIYQALESGLTTRTDIEGRLASVLDSSWESVPMNQTPYSTFTTGRGEARIEQKPGLGVICTQNCPEGIVAQHLYGNMEEFVSQFSNTIDLVEVLDELGENLESFRFPSLVKGAYAQETNTSTNSFFYLPESGFYTLEIGGIEIADKVETGDDIVHMFYIETNGIEGFQMPEDIENPTWEEDYVITSNALEIEYKKIGNLERRTFKEGINIISFENFIELGEDDEYTTAMDFVTWARKQGADIRSISRFKGGRWESGVRCDGSEESSCYGADFNIIPGEGYVVIANEDISLGLPVKQIKDSVPLALSSGWNLVGVHGYSTAYTAKTLINSVNTVSGLVADNVSWWPTSKGRYEGLQVSGGQTYGLDFPISTQNGYFVRISDFNPSDSGCSSIIWQPNGKLNGQCW